MILNQTSGYSKITTFSLSNSSLSSYEISWGDGTIESVYPYEHIYTSPGVYTVVLRSCETSACNSTDLLTSVNVNVVDYISPKIELSTNPSSAYVGCGATFVLAFSSLYEVTNFHFYSSGSDSAPYTDEISFWSHLTPEWKFTDEDENPISVVTLTGNPITAGNNETIAYSGTYTFKYYDDMPETPILFVTMEIPNTNSRVYTGVTHEVVPLIPDIINVTEDGIKDISEIQWAGVPIPFLISVGSTSACNNKILHYTTASGISAEFNSKCVFINENYSFPLISATDIDCFPTGGYLLSSITIPTSAIPSISSVRVEDECNRTGIYEIEVERKPATNAVITVQLTVSDGLSSYTLSGQSNEFKVYPFEDFNAFRRHGESRNISAEMKKYSTERFKEFTELWEYTDAILGSDINGLGVRTFYSIDQFAKNHSDIDRCNITSLNNIAKALNVSVDNQFISMPYELQRVIELASITPEKALGRRCVCNTNFVNCENCCNVNICTKCGFDKRSNIGDFINQTDYLTAGEFILYKENGSEIYDILEITSQSGEDTFVLSSLTADIVLEKGIDNLCFFRWDQSHQNNPIEAEVDYNSEFTLLSPSVSTIEEWYGENGVVEEMLNYILTKNLELD